MRNIDTYISEALIGRMKGEEGRTIGTEEMEEEILWSMIKWMYLRPDSHKVMTIRREEDTFIIDMTKIYQAIVIRDAKRPFPTLDIRLEGRQEDCPALYLQMPSLRGDDARLLCKTMSGMIFGDISLPNKMKDISDFEFNVMLDKGGRAMLMYNDDPTASAVRINNGTIWLHGPGKKPPMYMYMMSSLTGDDVYIKGKTPGAANYFARYISKDYSCQSDNLIEEAAREVAEQMDPAKIPHDYDAYIKEGSQFLKMLDKEVHCPWSRSWTDAYEFKLHIWGSDKSQAELSRSSSIGNRFRIDLLPSDELYWKMEKEAAAKITASKSINK